MQFARKDKYIAAEEMEKIIKTAAQPFDWQWVDAINHDDAHRAGAEARLKWLLPKIGVTWPRAF